MLLMLRGILTARGMLLSQSGLDTQHAPTSHSTWTVRDWLMVSSLADSERVRRLLRHRTRSAPPCGVSCGPRAYWVRVPADSCCCPNSDGRRLLFHDFHEL
jgi:hypothetical protein